MLEPLGHRAIAVDLPCTDPAATLDDYAAAVVAAMVCTEDKIIPPAKQREMAACLGVEPIEIASEHAVFTLQPRALAAVLAAQVRST